MIIRVLMVSYLKTGTDNARLVDIFNRYIAAIDSSRSVRQHENGEQRLISKYIEQQNQQKLCGWCSAGCCRADYRVSGLSLASAHCSGIGAQSI